jgi:hypothetical protein
VAIRAEVKNVLRHIGPIMGATQGLNMAGFRIGTCRCFHAASLSAPIRRRNPHWTELTQRVLEDMYRDPHGGGKFDGIEKILGISFKELGNDPRISSELLQWELTPHWAVVPRYGGVEAVDTAPSWRQR